MTRLHTLGVVGAFALVGGLVTWPEPSAALLEAAPARLPLIRQEQYVVNARIRPLFVFWVGRDNIGAGRIAWRGSPDGTTGIEFLIGSEPARTPRQINRWGYVAEEVDHNEARVIGLMRDSGEETFEQAKANVEHEGERSVFKAIRTTIAGGRAITQAITLQAPSTVTYRGVDMLLAAMPMTGRPHEIELPPGTESGFLSALTGMLKRTPSSCAAARAPVPTTHYLYNQTVYDLVMVSVTCRSTLHVDKRTFREVIEGHFEVRNRRTADVTKFELDYGVSGPLREVPIRAVFRPRWWMEIELVLAPDGSTSPADAATSAGALRLPS